MCEFMLCLLDLRVVGDGHRPTLDSSMNWLTKFAKNRQLEHQNTTMESQNSKRDGTCRR